MKATRTTSVPPTTSPGPLLCSSASIQRSAWKVDSANFACIGFEELTLPRGRLFWCGGVTIVQDPEEALFARMPESALEYVDVDHCLSLDKIAAQLIRLAGEVREEEGGFPMPKDMELEQKMSELDLATLGRDERPGEISGFTCPDCAGPLFEIRGGELSRYRCRVGHAYGSAEDLLEKNRDKLEDTLYFALNKLQENAAIAGRLAVRARNRGQELAAARLEKRDRESRQHAETLRRVLLGSPHPEEQTSSPSDLE